MSVNANLMANITCEDYKALEEMKNNGIDIFHINKQLASLAFVIQTSRNIKMIEWLLKNGADVDEIDEAGDTALMHAIRGQLGVSLGSLITVSSSLIDLLLNYHPNLNVINKDGESALFYASKNGFVDLVKLLLKSGALVETAIQKAIQNENDNHSIRHSLHLYKHEILDILIDAGILNYLSIDEILFLSLTLRNDLEEGLIKKILNFAQKNRLLDFRYNKFAADILILSPSKAEEYFLHGVPIDFQNEEGGALGELGAMRVGTIMSFMLIQKIKNRELIEDELEAFMDSGARFEYRIVENYNTLLHVACSIDIGVTNILLKWISEHYNKEEQRKLLSQKNRQNKTPLDLALELMNDQKIALKHLLPFKNLIQPFVDECTVNTMKFLLGMDLKEKMELLPKEVKAHIFEFDNDFLEFDHSSDAKNFMESAFERSIVSQTLTKTSYRSVIDWIMTSFKQSMPTNVHLEDSVVKTILDYCDDIKMEGLHYKWSALHDESNRLESERSTLHSENDTLTSGNRYT